MARMACIVATAWLRCDTMPAGGAQIANAFYGDQVMNRKSLGREIPDSGKLVKVAKPVSSGIVVATSN